MYLYYYSHKDDSITEIESSKRSVIVSKIDSIDFSIDCEFTISKEDSALTLRKDGDSLYVSVECKNDNSIERHGVRLNDKETFEKFLFEYIDELNYAKTVNNLKEYNYQRKEQEKEKYAEWKEDYKVTRKIENKKKYRNLLVLLAVISAVVVCCYYMISGEYKFIGHNTTVVKAKIVNVSFYPVPGGFKENIRYEYIYKNEKFKGSENIGRRVGMMDVGDLIELKISMKKPERHIVIGYYK